MNSLTAEFTRFMLDSERPSSFIWENSRWRVRNRKETITKFLNATMDEVRLHHATRIAEEVLKPIDMHDCIFFLRGLLRREVGRDISYQQQRDHSAHTLYNYLLGWYFLVHCSDIRNAIEAEFEHRGLLDGRDVYSCFADIWPYVSLLHDVGYLFEGSLAPLSTDVQTRQVSIGVSVVRDYFTSSFWTTIDMGSHLERETALKAASCQVPEIDSTSIVAISDTLRDLGALDALAQHLDLGKRSRVGAVLPSDAFDLWEQNYRFFNRASMAKRLTAIRSTFEDYQQVGFGKSGIRILDHGVCSGLLLLLQTTFYYRLRYGVRANGESSAVNSAIAGKLMSFESAEYPVDWWWAALVWATACAGIHNIQQQAPATGGVRVPKLAIEEDPLAFLGILVDCIQDWDRFSVMPQSILTGDLPLQGCEVQLGHRNGRIRLNLMYGDKSAKVRSDLESSLLGWRDYVEIGPA